MKYPELNLYSGLKKKKRPKRRYPFAFPGLTPDIYFPFTNIPRPIYKGLRDYPQYFGIKEKKPRYLKKKKPPKKKS